MCKESFILTFNSHITRKFAVRKAVVQFVADGIRAERGKSGQHRASYFLT